MNGLAFNVLAAIGALALLCVLALLGLFVQFWLADRRRARQQVRRMERARAVEDRAWAEMEETDLALCRTLDEIKALPVASPWSVM